MQMDDDIAHFGVVNGPLCGGAPSFFSFVIVGKDSDDVELVEFLEIESLRIAYAAAENKMQFCLSHCCQFLG